MVPGAEGGRKGGASAATPGRGSALLEEGVVAAPWFAQARAGLQLLGSSWHSLEHRPSPGRPQAAASPLHGHTGSGGPGGRLLVASCTCVAGIRVCRGDGGISTAGVEHMGSWLGGPYLWEDREKVSGWDRQPEACSTVSQEGDTRPHQSCKVTEPLAGLMPRSSATCPCQLPPRRCQKQQAPLLLQCPSTFVCWENSLCPQDRRKASRTVSYCRACVGG